MLKKIFLFLLVILIIIQFIHPEKNKATGPQANYIGNAHPVPDDVKIILAKACNDCHSNNTEYPWYSAIQPVDWWMNGHVNDGKKHLNLDDYTKRSLRYQYHKLEEIEEQIKERMAMTRSFFIVLGLVVKATIFFIHPAEKPTAFAFLLSIPTFLLMTSD